MYIYIYIKPRDYTKANNVEKKSKTSFAEKNIMRYSNETFQGGNEIKIHARHSLYFLSPPIRLRILHSEDLNGEENSLYRDRIFIHAESSSRKRKTLATTWERLKRRRARDKRTRLIYDIPATISVFIMFQRGLRAEVSANARRVLSLFHRAFQLENPLFLSLSLRNRPLSSSSSSSFRKWFSTKGAEEISTNGERKCLRGPVINFTACRVPRQNERL